MPRLRLFACLLLPLGPLLLADDWPEWRGSGRRGVWRESGILDRFPADGLKVRWRTPIRGGYSGPAVAAGRVYVTDFERTGPNHGNERALALEESSGRILWTREWPANYTGLQGTYAIGPRATPTVAGGRVYVSGTAGALLCLDAATGAVYWRKDYGEEYHASLPVWGMAGAPLVFDNRVIAIVGGARNALVVAFDAQTGKEVWRALETRTEPGYSQPFLAEAGGRQQLVIWHPAGVASLDPRTGKQFWELPFKSNLGLTVATPVQSGPRLLISSFYNGSMLMEMGAREPKARELWRGASASEIDTDGLHALISTPVIDGDYIYGICSYGQLRCLDARTGKRVWETLEATREKARWSTGHIVRHQDRYFINNDRGELILARLSPAGYQEIDRAKLIEPTSAVGGGRNRRELGAVAWPHPAYANRHIVMRNDREILRASLERE